jgi:hypothetical protein
VAELPFRTVERSFGSFDAPAEVGDWLVMQDGWAASHTALDHAEVTVAVFTDHLLLRWKIGGSLGDAPIVRAIEKRLSTRSPSASDRGTVGR